MLKDCLNNEKHKEAIKILEEAKQPPSDFVKLMDNFKDPYLVLIACIFKA